MSRPQRLCAATRRLHGAVRTRATRACALPLLRTSSTCLASKRSRSCSTTPSLRAERAGLRACSCARLACACRLSQHTHTPSSCPFLCSAQRHRQILQWQQSSAQTVRAVRARASAGLYALTRACNTRSLTHSAHTNACLQAWRMGAASGPRSRRRGSASLHTMGCSSLACGKSGGIAGGAATCHSERSRCTPSCAVCIALTAPSLL